MALHDQSPLPLRNDNVVLLVAEVPVAPTPGLEALRNSLYHPLRIDPPSDLQPKVHIAVSSAGPSPLQHLAAQPRANDDPAHRLELVVVQGVQPVGEVLEDSVVPAAVAGLEDESVVGVEHELCLVADLAAGHGEVEARGELEGGPDVLVVHVDCAAVCSERPGWLA